MGAEVRDGVFCAPDGVPLTLWWDADAAPGGALRLVDQTRLPGKYAVIACATAEEVADAIRTLQVRGAPAIGVAAAYGLALGARTAMARPLSAAAALTALAAAADTLRATRPTAVNLAWALDRLLSRARSELQGDEASGMLPAALLAEAHAIATEDAAACRAMGALGAE
ncbi:MAG TPA: hypothetical protein VGR57_16320, partial [Ktedonobacterales bacterium]|nr:hypothetical protein [Ktedonobacterales bacterium]